LFRRLHIRTSKEIHTEMLALSMLRGDVGTRPASAEAALGKAERALNA
jgi:hypothetical protein